MPHNTRWKSSTCLTIGAAAFMFAVSTTASLGAGERREAIGRDMARMHETEMQAHMFGPSSQVRVVNVPASASLIGVHGTAPPSHGIVPSVATRSPADSVRAPVAAHSIPASSANLPPAGTRSPIATARDPMVGRSIPASGPNLPTADTRSPIAAAREPVAAREIPAAAINVPAAATRIPATSTGRPIYTPLGVSNVPAAASRGSTVNSVHRIYIPRSPY